MKPVDPRLLTHARATRGFLALTVVLGTAGAGLVLVQAGLLARVIVAAFEEEAAVGDLWPELGLLAGVIVARSAISWLTEVIAHRTSAAVKSQLRSRLLAHVVRLGPAWLNNERSGELTTLATRGVDALDGYFARYLPQLILSVTVPVAVLARVVFGDWISAVTIVVTLPLIPLFMALIGMATQKYMDRQWTVLNRLAGHFLDVVAGLPTLKVFGRAKAQAASIRTITDDYRRATLKTLRVAFLSSFALELLATISVALVAVGVGLRLVDGELSLETALVVLILAPEAYLPLRQVGAEYHASVEGVSAADRVFAVLETTPDAPATTVPVPDPRSAELVLTGLTVRHEGRADAAPADLDLTVRPGETIALTGPSGCGKSTVLAVLLGFTRPTAGRVTVGGVDLAELDPDAWRARIAWVPQRPYLFAGTIGANVRLARPDAGDAEVHDALVAAGAADFVAASGGLDAPLGEDGAGLSAGQRQRLALARAFLADRPILLLDEPTSNLDGAGEADIVEAVRRLAVGRTVVLVAHRPALLPLADRVVAVGTGAAARTTKGAHAVGTARVLPAEVEAARAADDVPAVEQPLVFPLADPPVAAGAGPGRRLLALARPLRGRLALAVLCGALALGSSVGLMATSAWLISRASQHPPVLTLMVAVTGVRAFGVSRAVFRYAERLIGHDAAFRILARLRVRVYERLERLAPAGLPAFRRGDLLSRLVADVDAVQDFFLRALLPACVAAVVGAGAVLTVALVLPEAGAVLLVGLLAAGVLVPWLAGRVARRAERRVAAVRGELAGAVVDLLRGTPELIVAGRAPARLAEVDAVDARLRATEAGQARGAGVGAGLAALVSGATVWASALVGVAAVHADRLNGVLLALVVLTPLAAFEATVVLPAAGRHLESSRRAAARVFEVIDAPEPVHEPAAPRALPAAPRPLLVRDLHARWTPDGPLALAGVDLELTPGKRVAVVGASGSGKTTLANVLLRFLDPAAGGVTLAGVPITDLAGDDVRRVVGLCAQDAHVFDSSLRENLRLARPDCDEDAMRAALARARLLDWVDTLPQGLDTMVGEHGARLSGGQRQRLALARALLADFEILLLDEPAEHLDLPTADALTADLLDATRGRTTLLVTHRLTGLHAVDEIVVLAEGRVRQRGTWGQLSTTPGAFRALLDREYPAGAVAARA
ncbi:thiol reductant ABC exporter subunit CydD [Embleya scabrispora]|uniref:thiol reductant ABC exporter subunit CydD n=1 Tax=Embleya scabrispora TaxID=159449 RepID=UPI00036A56BC|nr:thiol reductant ABC exporter subunit CydD [Embleya scabrispora]MYS79866.1 thiol reductant ABC exporter subunit CydD [Streptomyces sp. SID5474]